LEEVVAYVESQGYDLSMLFTGAPSLYAALGWQPVPERLTSFSWPAIARPSAGCREGDWERDLEAVAEVYDAFNANRTGTLVRTLPYWRACRLWIPDEDDARFLVAEHDGEVVAYARGTRKRNVIMELGYRPGCERVLRALLAAVQERFGPGPAAAYVPEDAAFDGFLAEHAEDVSRDPRRVPGTELTMFRPVRMRDLAQLRGFCFYYADHF
jgi:hypothetical protein